MRENSELLSNVLEIKPTSKFSHFYLGLAYKALDQPAEAIGAFEQALVSAQDEVMRVRIRRHLNELYEVERQSRVP